MTKSELVGVPRDLISQTLDSGYALFDDGKKTWNQLVDQILNTHGRIIALRGAGSINGADYSEAERLLEAELIPRVESSLANGEQVIYLYDGDTDSIEKPDIGYFTGRLLDRFGNNENRVVFIAAQKRSWYYPPKDGGNLVNANGKSFATYVFDDNVYPGDHNAFTQDARLVAVNKYEQWYIGASGDIATGQLLDYNKKVPEGEKRHATLFRVRNNPNLENEIQAKLNAAQAMNDEVNVMRLQKQVSQRQNVYGSHWNNIGEPIISKRQFPKLDISFVVPR